jgi:hypothetical protein
MTTVAVIALAYLGLSFFRDGTFIWLLSQQEGGVWVDEAIRVLHGEQIYRDFFDFIAPGNVYLYAAAFAIFGDSTRTVGGLVVCLGVIAALLVHAVAARLLPLAWRASATAVFLVYAYQPYSPLNHKWPTFIFCLSGLLILLSRRSASRCLAAGVALAAATLCTQDMGSGAAMGLAVGLWFLRERESQRPFALFLIAYAVTLVSALAALAIHVGLPTLWYDLIAFPAAQYRNLVKFTVVLGEPLAAPRTLTVFTLGILGAGFMVTGLVRRFWRVESAPTILVTLMGTGLLFLGSWVRPIEPVGFGVRAMPIMLMGLYAMRKALAPERGAFAQRVRFAVSVFFTATLGPIAVVQLVHAQWTRPLVLREHRAGPIWEPSPMEDLAWIERQTVAGNMVFLFPFKGGFYFLSRTRNATSFPMVLDMHFTTDDQIRSAGAELAANCPAAGAWDHRRLADQIEHSSLRRLYLGIQRDYDSRGRLPDDVELFTRKAEREHGCLPTL